MNKSAFGWLGVLLVVAILAAVPAAGRDTLPAILAKRATSMPPLDPFAPAWSRLKPVAVVLYPQFSVAPGAQSSGVSTLNVRALYRGRTVALHLEWRDAKPTHDRAIGMFADAAAVQWPVYYGSRMPLPYVGMGHAGAPVAVWFWRADQSVETLAAEGFGTLTPQPNDGVTARGVWKDGVWRLVFMRMLDTPAGGYSARLDPAAHGLVPVAFAVWNGEAGERNGSKRLSAWINLRFDKARVEAAYARVLVDPPLAGDVGNGKHLMTEQGCAGCHAFPGSPERPSVGPDLTYVGGIHSTRYLMESLKEPSRVIVPGKLHAMVEDGKRISVMPPFAGTEQELWDIVAFLKTLH